PDIIGEHLFDVARDLCMDMRDASFVVGHLADSANLSHQWLYSSGHGTHPNKLLLLWSDVDGICARRSGSWSPFGRRWFHGHAWHGSRLFPFRRLRRGSFLGLYELHGAYRAVSRLLRVIVRMHRAIVIIFGGSPRSAAIADPRPARAY